MLTAPGSACRSLEQRIDKRRDRTSLRQNDKSPENHHHEKDRQQPILLADSHEKPELSKEVHLFLKIDISSNPGRARAVVSETNSCLRANQVLKAERPFSADVKRNQLGSRRRKKLFPA